MSHLAIRSLIRDVAKSLSDKIQFGYGRRSEFNFIEKKRYPFIWMLPLNASGRFRTSPTKTKTWNVALLFLDEDEADSNADQSTKILDDRDAVVDRFTQALDDWYERSYDTVGAFTIQNDNQQPFYKDDSDIHTGWLLTFQIVVSDDFDYCTPENVDLYAGNI